MADRVISVRDLQSAPGETVFPSPEDWRDQVIYHLLIDRFDDDRPGRAAYEAGLPKGRMESEGKIFQGGKLRGITRRLDYIRNLGCSAIWISPPFKNRQDDPHSYHGYGIQDFLSVDPRFGTLADLRQLVREAHARGMYVILDIVVNHTGDVWTYAGNKPRPFNEKGCYEFGAWRKKDPASATLGPDDAVWPVELQRPGCFTRKGYIRNFFRCGEAEAVQGDFYSLKDLNLDDAATLETIIQIYKYWIAAADIDGYRIDSVRHVKSEPMAAFCEAIHEYARAIGKQNFLIFGEIMGDETLLRKYIGQNTPVHGEGVRYPRFDAVLDFPLYGLLDEVLKGTKSVQCLRQRYEGLERHYREFAEVSRYFVTFVDDHDQAYRPHKRFLHGVNDARLGMLAGGYLLMGMGIPCLYYGTEQGFDGGGKSDIHIRECMFGGTWGAFETTGVHFFNESHPIYRGIAAVARVRANEPALRYGRQHFRKTSANGVDFAMPAAGPCLLAFSRVLDRQELLVVMNLDASPRREYVAVDGKLTPAGCKMVDLLNGGEAMWVEHHPGGRACVQVRLEGYGMAILKIDSSPPNSGPVGV